MLLTPKIREECRKCICKPLVYNTISKDLVFFKQHAPIKLFRLQPIFLIILTSCRNTSKNLLSLMTITRERQPDYPGREVGWCRNPCPLSRSMQRIWNFHRNYAERGGINDLTGARCPCHFLRFVIQSMKEKEICRGTYR